MIGHLFSYKLIVEIYVIMVLYFVKYLFLYLSFYFLKACDVYVDFKDDVKYLKCVRSAVLGRI